MNHTAVQYENSGRGHAAQTVLEQHTEIHLASTTPFGPLVRHDVAAGILGCAEVQQIQTQHVERWTQRCEALVV